MFEKIINSASELIKNTKAIEESKDEFTDNKPVEEDSINSTNGTNGTKGSDGSIEKSKPVEKKVIQQPSSKKTASTGSALDKSNNDLDYSLLPSLLQTIVSIGEDKVEKEIVLLSALTFLSSIAPSVSFKYGKSRYYLNLYLFVVARAGSGKSIVGRIKNILNKVDDHMLKVCNNQWSAYQAKKSSNSTLKVPEPVCGGLFLSEDHTKASLYEALEESSDYNMIYSSEAISASTSGEMFDTRDILLKASEHERVSYRRKGRRAKVFNEPKISLLLTGTESSVQTQTRGKEDGTFSRIMWYKFGGGKPKWKSQLDTDVDQIDKIISNASDQVLEIYKHAKRHKFEFKLSSIQKTKFNLLFESFIKKMDDKKDSHFESFIKRLAHKFLRIAGVITLCSRVENHRTSGVEECTDQIFDFVYTLVEMLHEHAYNIFNSLDKGIISQPKVTSDKILELIPIGKALKRSHIDELISSLDFSEKHVSTQLTKLVALNKLKRIKKGVYRREN